MSTDSTNTPDSHEGGEPAPGSDRTAFLEAVAEITQGEGIEAAEVEQLADHAWRVVGCNQRFNLTRIVEPAEVARQQVLDSIRIARALRETAAGSVMDLGSGTGYPGIPLAILQPDRQVTLCESVKKKASFLEETVRESGVPNLAVRAERGEQVLREESFELVLARAVGSIEKMLGLLHPVRRCFSYLAIAKGPRLSDEMEDAQRFFGGDGPYEVVDLKSYDIGGGYSKRFLLLIRPRIVDSKRRGPRRLHRGPHGC